MSIGTESKVYYNIDTILSKQSVIDEPDNNIAEHLAERIATELVKDVGPGSRVLTTAYAVLVATLVSVLRGVAPEVVASAAAIGIALVWLVNRLERKKLCKHLYQQELSHICSLIHGTNEQQKDRTQMTGIVYALAAAVDAKDHYTYGHCAKVAKYAVDIAKALGYSSSSIERVHKAASLHDIGKIGIPDQMLTKHGSFSVKEWKLMCSHPDKGIAILKHVNGLNGSLDGVRYHHERYDGSGYPRGLKGEDTPLDARILAVADAYDAMTSKRPYRPAGMTCEQALEELRRCAGKQFDPQIVRIFAGLREKPKPVTCSTGEPVCPIV